MEEAEPPSELVIVTDEGKEFGDGDIDLQTIRDVLSVHHVPVVASLHWNKLHSVLHSLCDRISLQALRLDKAEEQGKNFLEFKDELDQLCRSAVREMKEARENDVEQRQSWSKMVEERLQNLQEGVDANGDGMKQLGNNLADQLHGLDARVEAFTTELDALQEAAKNFDRLDALEEATKSLEAVQATQPGSFETLNQKLEELLLDFEEQNDKLHSLEEQNEQLKLKVEQTAKSHASDLDALQQYCRNLRSDFEMKFLVDVSKMQPSVDEELSSASKAKVEAAVAELQNRIQKKADSDDLEKIAQSTQIVKDAFEKMESNIVELQSQVKKLTPGSRRASRLSLSAAPVPPDIQLLIPDAKTATLQNLSPTLVEELTKDVKEAIEDHKKELEKVQKDFGLLGKSILILSGHHEQQLKNDESSNTPDKLLKIIGDVRDVPKLVPGSSESNQQAGIATLDTMVVEKAEFVPESKRSKSFCKLDIEAVKRASKAIGPSSAVLTVEQMDDNAIIQAIDEALKSNRFEPKESMKAMSKILDELEKATTRLTELDTAMPALKDGLVLKADKQDLQRLARYVKEQLERPENVLFTRKPLYGFKCVSCDHPIEKLSSVTGEHLPTNRMPPQIFPMLSAERIYSLDRRGSNGSSQHAQVLPNKSWNGGPVNANGSGGGLLMSDNHGDHVSGSRRPAQKGSSVAPSMRKRSPLRRAGTAVN